MTDPAEAVSHALATNLRAARQARGWRLEDLAGRSGVSRGMLQQIETGRTNPSIATLARICGTLGISIGQLVEAPEELGLAVRANDVPVLAAGAASTAKLLVNEGQAPFVELWDFEFAPHDEVSSAGHPQGTKELLHVRTGALAVTVGGASFELGPGDALRMRGDRPHTYRNPGAEPTLVTMTVVYSGNRDPRFIPRD